MLFYNFLFILAGYLLGSILFARIGTVLFRKKEALNQSNDGNPGAANAFQYGGFGCGVFTLLGDFLKGFLPVFLFTNFTDFPSNFLMKALILAAPVVGHIFPLFYKFKGGKGISTSFGCLIGLFPKAYLPFLILALVFIFFSVILRISPNFYKTVVAYLLTLAIMIFTVEPYVTVGFLFIVISVMIRMLLSTEKKEKCKVNLLWMR